VRFDLKHDGWRIKTNMSTAFTHQPFIPMVRLKANTPMIEPLNYWTFKLLFILSTVRRSSP